jgi:hypothetical protein
MHGLINRSLQCFVRDTYGQETWARVAARAECGLEGFEALAIYDDMLTERVLAAASALLDKPREALLEDLGTYLVSHPKLEPVRRLLRFGGETFEDFLHSLGDLQGRARLAVPDLEVPEIDLRGHAPGSYTLNCRFGLAGSGYVMMGILRALADDYGALVLLDHLGRQGRAEILSVRLLDPRFTEGRRFTLAAQGG